jgi:hypothetical protein
LYTSRWRLFPKIWMESKYSITFVPLGPVFHCTHVLYGGLLVTKIAVACLALDFVKHVKLVLRFYWINASAMSHVQIDATLANDEALR